MTNTRAAKSCPFLVFSLIPFKSLSIFQVILINGVLFRLISVFFLISVSALSAMPFKKFPFSLDPIEYIVLLSAPLTFLTSNFESSRLVNSKTFVSAELVEVNEIKIEDVMSELEKRKK